MYTVSDAEVDKSDMLNFLDAVATLLPDNLPSFWTK